MKLISTLSILLIFTSCGKWWAHRQSEILSIELEGRGKAKLLEAESEKKIAIEEARAKLESAKLLSLAEIERAKGAAEANRIIGTSLKENEAYLKYLWIQNMNTKGEVIYVPTEAGLPILEAGRRK